MADVVVYDFKNLFPISRRRVRDIANPSNILPVEKVKLRAAIREIGKIARCGFSLGRGQSGLEGIRLVKMQRGDEVDRAGANGISDGACTYLVLLQAGNFLRKRNVDRGVVLVESFSALWRFVEYEKFLPFDLSSLCVGLDRPGPALQPI